MNKNATNEQKAVYVKQVVPEIDLFKIGGRQIVDIKVTHSVRTQTKDGQDDDTHFKGILIKLPGKFKDNSLELPGDMSKEDLKKLFEAIKVGLDYFAK